jgi:hypothetical protein
MRTLKQMTETYSRKLTAFWKNAPNPPDIPAMVHEYTVRMTDLRDKQMLAKDILNEAGIPGAKQATFQVLCNHFWFLTTVKDYGGDTAIAEFGAAIALFTIKFSWVVLDIALAKKIAKQVFDVIVV